MEAKDTVMGTFRRNRYHDLGLLKTILVTTEERDEAMCLDQAEITWKARDNEVAEARKAALQEVVDWIKENHWEYHIWERKTLQSDERNEDVLCVNPEEWQAKLKEWGIEEVNDEQKE